jgi:hypothetical protein
VATDNFNKQKVRNKIADLLQYFEGLEVEPGQSVKLDAATTITDCEKFINFSRARVKDVEIVTPANKPYIVRLHKLRLHYEQKQKTTGQTR